MGGKTLSATVNANKYPSLGLMKNGLRALVMFVTAMSASACGGGSPNTNATANTANGRPTNVAVSNSATEGKTAADPAWNANVTQVSPAAAKGEILCEPGDSHFKSQHTTDDGLEYYECYNGKKDVSVAAYFTRMKGISYMILGVGWTLEEGAAPLPVIASSVSVKYVGADGRTAQLSPVFHLDPDYDSTLEIMFAERHGLRAKTIGPGRGHFGIVYFSMPERTDSPEDKGDGRYVAEVRVRGEVVVFQFPAANLRTEN